MDNQPIEYTIGEFLRKRKFKLALAESCTGGLVSHRITNVPGSSEYFPGSIIAYQNDVKVNLLEVPKETLEVAGVVSLETVIAMAIGVRKILDADIGMSISGIAGPTGGTPENPVGTVCIGISTPGREKAWRVIFKGNRIQIKKKAAQSVLQHLLDYLTEKSTFEYVVVSFRSDTNQNIIPTKFILQDEEIPLISIGRRWQDAKGHHFLVMAPNHETFELLYNNSRNRWYAKPIRYGHKPA